VFNWQYFGFSFHCSRLVVLEKSLPAWACRALFGIAAIAIGLDSAVETGSTATALKTLLGTWLCLVVLVFDLGAYALHETKVGEGGDTRGRFMDNRDHSAGAGVFPPKVKPCAAPGAIRSVIKSPAGRLTKGGMECYVRGHKCD